MRPTTLKLRILTDSHQCSDPPPDLDPSSVQTYLDGIAAYIYGYSLLSIAMTERVATNVPNATSKTGRAPINQLYRATELPVGSSYTDVVLPSTTTMYAPAFIDLTDGPLILHTRPAIRFPVTAHGTGSTLLREYVSYEIGDVLRENYWLWETHRDLAGRSVTRLRIASGRAYRSTSSLENVRSCCARAIPSPMEYRE